MSDKKIFKNYIYNLIYQIIVIILPIVTTPYLSRVLGAENIGVYGYTTSVVAYFTLIGALGINKYGQREIAYVQNDISKRSKVFWELNIVKTSSILIAAVIFYLAFCINGEYAVFYRILLIEIVAASLDISWFFQGMENFKKVVIRNLLIKIISVVLIFVLVKNANDLIKYFCILVFSNFFGNIVLWLDIKKYIKKEEIRVREIRRHFKPMISLFIPQIATSIYTILDKTMIGLLSDNIVEVGYYEQSQKIIKLALTLVTTMGIVLLPRISNAFAQGEDKKMAKYMTKSFKFDYFLAFPITFGMMAIASNLVPWFFGSGYEKIVYLLFIGSPVIIFIALSTTIGTQYLVSIKKQNVQTLAVVTGAMINCTLNLILIPLYASIGAVIATVIAEFFIAVIEIVYVIKKKIISARDIFGGISKYLIASIIMFLVVYLVARSLSIGIVYTIIEILIGVITYIVILLIMKDEFLIDIKGVLIKSKLERRQKL